MLVYGFLDNSENKDRYTQNIGKYMMLSVALN